MPVRPVHHWRHTESVVDGVCDAQRNTLFFYLVSLHVELAVSRTASNKTWEVTL
jgi:hypothetical protein